MTTDLLMETKEGQVREQYKQELRHLIEEEIIDFCGRHSYWDGVYRLRWYSPPVVVKDGYFILNIELSTHKDELINDLEYTLQRLYHISPRMLIKWNGVPVRDEN